jgi:serine/threonine protein kinase
VAIKLIPAELSAAPELRVRLRREAEAVSALSHAHICTVYDIGSEGEIEYIVMEYLEGETLAERIARKPLPIADALNYGAEFRRRPLTVSHLEEVAEVLTRRVVERVS